jgi:hypothetical protein
LLIQKTTTYEELYMKNRLLVANGLVTALLTIGIEKAHAVFITVEDAGFTSSGLPNLTSETNFSTRNNNCGLGDVRVSLAPRVDRDIIFTTQSLVGRRVNPLGGCYAAVPGSFSGGTAELVFDGLHDYLGLFWGSIDPDNQITFLNNGLVVATVFGREVLRLLPSGSGFVNIFLNPDPFMTNIFFTSARFSTPGFAFEFDNLATARLREPLVAGGNPPYPYPHPGPPIDRPPGVLPLAAIPGLNATAVPTPASLGLFAACLMGLGLTLQGRHKTNKGAPTRT